MRGEQLAPVCFVATAPARRAGFFVSRTAAVMLGALLVAGEASAAGGELLWEDQVDRGIDFGNAVATSGKRVYAAGFSQDGAGDVGYVRAYDARTGVLRWEHESRSSGIARLLVARGKRVFASGTSFLRSLDAQGGVLLWEDDPGGDFHGIAATKGRVIVAGSRSDGVNVDLLVRVQNAKTGALHWEDVFDSGDEDCGEDAFDSAYAVAVAAGRIFAVGGTLGGALIARAYDAGTGNLLWTDERGTPATAFAVVVTGDVVVALGDFPQGDGTSSPFARAYHARTGALRWEDRIDSQAIGSFTAAAAQGGKVFAAGTDGSFLVQAYDAATGARLWSRRSTASGQAATIVDRRGLVFAAGTTNDFADWVVEAYDARTGALRWEDRFDGGAGFGLARDAEEARGAVFAVGDVRTDTRFSDFVLRAYDAE